MQYNFSRFGLPVTSADKQAYRQAHPYHRGTRIFFYIAGFVLPVILFIVTLITVLVTAGTGNNDPVAYSIVFFLMSLGVTIYVIIALIRDARDRVQNIRLGRFAADNGFTYAPEQSSREYAGLIFKQSYEGIIHDALRSQNGAIEIGTYTAKVDNPISQISNRRQDFTLKRSYVRLALPATLPKLFLQGYKSIGLTMQGDAESQMVSFPDSSRVSLEGDFDKHFKTYAPEGMNVDARVILTPDVMQLLMAQANGCDVEIIDGELFVYSRYLSFSEPNNIGYLLNVGMALREKLGVSAVAVQTNASPVLTAMTAPVQVTTGARQQHLQRRSSVIVATFVFIMSILYTISMVYKFFHGN